MSRLIIDKLSLLFHASYLVLWEMIIAIRIIVKVALNLYIGSIDILTIKGFQLYTKNEKLTTDLSCILV